MKFTNFNYMRIKITLFLILSLCFSRPLFASETKLKRTVLAIYDSTETYNKTDDYNFIHNNASVVINYLGLKVKYHDINNGIPEIDDDVIGILSWFKDDVLLNAKEYCLWATSQIKSGRKFVVLGSFGAFRDRISNKIVPMNIVNNFFNALFLDYQGQSTENQLVIELGFKDEKVVEFERTVEGEMDNYVKFSSLSSDNKIYLRLIRTDLKDSSSPVVVITPTGGLALNRYEVYVDYESGAVQWRINPFRFFSEAFGIDDYPRIDMTTLLGKRIFYSHIDGDGVRNVSDINLKLSGEVIYEEILSKYKLPITVSFIISELDPNIYGTKQLKDLAINIAELDNVEMGVHGYSHPLDWKRQLVAYLIKGYSFKAETKSDEDLVSESHYGDSAIVNLPKEQFLNKEIKDATLFMNVFLNSIDKKVKLYQWTGDCLPTFDAVKMAKELNLKNINGGDSRFDSEYASYTYLSPLARQIDGQIQFYTSNANENIYTNLWRGPFYGYKYVVETFQQTENASLVDGKYRRIAPINIYYHFYSGEKKESLNALKSVYDYALTQNIIPVFTSEYISIVENFFSAEIYQIDKEKWKIKNYDSSLTVRFDSNKKFVDMNLSYGVIGYNYWHEFLYVYLDSARNEAEIVLSDKKTNAIFVKDSNCEINKWALSEKVLTFETRSFDVCEINLENLKANKKYRVDVFDAETIKKKFSGSFLSDMNGELNIKLKTKDKMQVQIKL